MPAAIRLSGVTGAIPDNMINADNGGGIRVVKDGAIVPPKSPPVVSAVICTLNRPHYLRLAIDSLMKQSMPVDQYEVLVVDNGPHEGTRAVAVDEFSSMMNLRYVIEPKLGLSVARRTAWQLASGRYVAYLDDDAIAAPYWLEQLVAAFVRTDPEPGCVGGPINLIWEAPRPTWLSSRLESNLTSLDLGTNVRELSEDEMVFGANMAFPHQILQEVDAFSEGLGRRGTALLSNEEILLQNQLKAAGYSRIYAPAASVRHHASPDRLTMGWFRRRAYGQGVSNALAERSQNELSAWRRLKTSVGQFRDALARPKIVWDAVFVQGDPARFEERFGIVMQLGYARGLTQRRENAD